MSAGEKEITLASEEVQRRNIQTVIAHATETRKMVGELGAMIDALQNQMIAQHKTIDQLRHQLATLQQQFYQRGTTSYNEE